MDRPWRDYLKTEERIDLDNLQQLARHFDHERGKVTHNMNLIRNRACQRARYAARSGKGEEPK